MRKMKFSVVALAVSATLWSGGAGADDTVEIAPIGVENPTANQRRICKTVAPTGSRIARRTCLTVAQWEEARKIAQEATEKGQASALLINMSGGGGGGGG